VHYYTVKIISETLLAPCYTRYPLTSQCSAHSVNYEYGWQNNCLNMYWTV